MKWAAAEFVSRKRTGFRVSVRSAGSLDRAGRCGVPDLVVGVDQRQYRVECPDLSNWNRPGAVPGTCRSRCTAWH